MTRLPHRTAAALVVLFAAGCSGPAMPKTYPVTGTVAYKGGQRLKGGSVQLTQPADSSLRVVGAIGEDGTFTLHTFRDNDKAAGAPEGEYQVVVLPPLAADPRGGVKGDHKGVVPIALPRPFKVQAGENTLPIELPVPPP
jgi:hypothetical protein